MSQYQSAMSPGQVEKAMRQNEFLHKYIMALDHALLWVAALSFAAFFMSRPILQKSRRCCFPHWLLMEHICARAVWRH